MRSFENDVWRGRRDFAVWVLTVLVCFVVIAVVVHIGATLLVHHKGDLPPADRLKATNDARTFLIQLLGGIGLIGGFFFTIRTYALTRRTQRTDRFAKASEQLGNESEAARAGGAYGLWLLASEADEFWPAVQELLAALVRERAEPETPLTADVQAALTVLGRRPVREPGERGAPLNLRGIDVRGADLAGANLDRARLDGARLSGANLVDARLARASLLGADLDSADLSSADLTNARLTGASLRGATCYQTKMEHTEVDGCDFTDAVSLTGVQLALTSGNPRALPA